MTGGGVKRAAARLAKLEALRGPGVPDVESRQVLRARYRRTLGAMRATAQRNMAKAALAAWRKSRPPVRVARARVRVKSKDPLRHLHSRARWLARYAAAQS